MLSSSHHKDPDEDAAVHTGRISDAIFGKAIEDFTSVLDEFKNNLLLAHWPHKGTLIALLRYGRIIGDLGDGIEDQVDYDLDWMVEGDSEEKWFLFDVAHRPFDWQWVAWVLLSCTSNGRRRNLGDLTPWLHSFDMRTRRKLWNRS